MIADVVTRWNSSYLAWKRLIKIKDLIDILASIMLIDPDPSTQYDSKRLKDINLTEEEWQEIKKLIIKLNSKTQIKINSNYSENYYIICHTRSS